MGGTYKNGQYKKNEKVESSVLKRKFLVILVYTFKTRNIFVLLNLIRKII
jgi:hypothetical protein